MSNTPETDRLKPMWDYWVSIRESAPQTMRMGSNVEVPTSVLSDWFDQVLSGVRRVETGEPDKGMMAIHWAGLQNQVTALLQTFSQIQQQGGAAAAIANNSTNLMNQLWSIRSTLPWLLPLSETPDVGTTFPRLSELIGAAEQVLSLRAQVSEASNEVKKQVVFVNDVTSKIEQTLTDVQGHERTAGNAQIATVASATGAKESVDALNELLEKMIVTSDVQTELLKLFESKKTLVDETLEGASKVALANSFQTRRMALAWGQKGWVAVFIAGLIAMTLVAANSVGPLLESASSVTQPNYLALASHALVLSPLIWLTWFAARKYGQVSRLTEDYAFKEAAAHAFVGYKREMGDDAEMLQLLRGNAIRNFGENPIRVLSNDEAASPLHDVLNKVLAGLDKLKPEQLSRLAGEFAKAYSQVTSK